MQEKKSIRHQASGIRRAEGKPVALWTLFISKEGLPTAVYIQSSHTVQQYECDSLYGDINHRHQQQGGNRMNDESQCIHAAVTTFTQQMTEPVSFLQQQQQISRQSNKAADRSSFMLSPAHLRLDGGTCTLRRLHRQQKRDPQTWP